MVIFDRQAIFAVLPTTKLTYNSDDQLVGMLILIALGNGSFQLSGFILSHLFNGIIHEAVNMQLFHMAM